MGESQIPRGRGGRCGFAEVRAVREPPLGGRGISGLGGSFTGGCPTYDRASGTSYRGPGIIQLGFVGFGFVWCGGEGWRWKTPY